MGNDPNTNVEYEKLTSLPPLTGELKAGDLAVRRQRCFKNCWLSSTGSR